MTKRRHFLPKVRTALLFSSGGYCQNPKCRTQLYDFFASGRITSIEELAHIIPHSDDGPRSNEDAPKDMRESFENIVVLCPNCHTLIDKNPDDFPVDLLLAWKSEHIALIDNSISTPKHSSRDSLRRDILRLLNENHTIFTTYGPSSAAAENPISDAAYHWRRLSILTVIPNNKSICQLLNANSQLLSQNDQSLYMRFKIHAEAFEYNQLSGDKNAAAPQFPQEFTTILTGSI